MCFKNPCKFNELGKCQNSNCLFRGIDCNLAFCENYEPKYKKEDCVYHYGDDRCYIDMPDSECDCEGICEHFIKSTNESQVNPSIEKVAIEGVGKEAEVITNENGGKQSKTPMALHLIDSEFFLEFVPTKALGSQAIINIIHFMSTGVKAYLIDAINSLEDEGINTLMKIGKVLQEGADKYEPNNWRLIPQESHINHALIHLFAYMLGDTQDNHKDHALCRIMMACATEPSENFSYTEYKKKVK